MRIRAKKLRYASEVFRPCLSGKTRRALKKELLPLLDRLGKVNDDVNIISRLEATSLKPEALCDDFLVERMIPEPVAEILIGIRRNSEFGQVLVLVDTPHTFAAAASSCLHQQGVADVLCRRH